MTEIGIFMLSSHFVSSFCTESSTYVIVGTEAHDCHKERDRETSVLTLADSAKY